MHQKEDRENPIEDSEFEDELIENVCKRRISIYTNRRRGRSFDTHSNSYQPSIEVQTNRVKIDDYSFQISNVNHLKILVECKQEIVNLIQPLQRSKQIIFSSHSIFKDYVTEKLLNSTDSGEYMRPTKKKEMIKIIEDKEFYEYLRNRFYVDCLNQNPEAQHVHKRRNHKKRTKCEYSMPPIRKIFPESKHKAMKKMQINSKIDNIPKCEIFMKEKQKKKKIKAIKKTCIFKALETFHNKNSDLAPNLRRESCDSYFDSESNDSIEKNDNQNLPEVRTPIAKMIEFIDKFVDDSQERLNQIKFGKAPDLIQKLQNNSSENYSTQLNFDSENMNSPLINTSSISNESKTQSKVIYCLPKRTLRKLLSFNLSSNLYQNSLKDVALSPSIKKENSRINEAINSKFHQRLEQNFDLNPFRENIRPRVISL